MLTLNNFSLEERLRDTHTESRKARTRRTSSNNLNCLDELRRVYNGSKIKCHTTRNKSGESTISFTQIIDLYPHKSDIAWLQSSLYIYMCVYVCVFSFFVCLFHFTSYQFLFIDMNTESLFKISLGNCWEIEFSY